MRVPSGSLVRRTAIPGIALAILALTGTTVSAATTPGSLSFSNAPLLRSEGGSEPAITIGANGQMAMTSLQWLFDPTFFGTHLWTGPFGSTPTFKGLIDANLEKPSGTIFGSGDADVDLGSTGRLHASTLVFLLNPTTRHAQLGVSAISCPNGTSPSFSIAACTSKVIDSAGADRQWITSDGPNVWISYHDAANSSLIRVQRSTDDGLTWKKVGDPIVGQDGVTANSTFNNIQGPIVADPLTHNVYAVFAAGETGFLKARTFTPNHVYVSRSTDGGMTWTANLVFQAPAGSDLGNVFPTLAVDPVTGKLYASWSDAHHVWFSSSSDQGTTWSAAVAANVAPATTAIFPWLAAFDGTVDLVYYGTTASSKDDPSAVWNTYLAQTVNDGASFTQSVVTSAPNHVGVICTNGTGCAAGTRNLLDLFEVAIDPQNGKAALIYTDDTLTKTSSGDPLPQVVLAQQN